MNSFVIEKIEEFDFEKVAYYSVRYIDSDEGTENDVNEFLDFLNRMEDILEIEKDLTNLLIWIEEIGETEGAKPKFFRNESIFADTAALPPPKGVMVFHKIQVNGLRLYCFVANLHVVFLFNGDIKSGNVSKAQDCARVAPHIKRANKLAKRIDELFKSGEISWNEHQTDIIFDKNQEFEL